MKITARASRTRNTGVASPPGYTLGCAIVLTTVPPRSILEAGPWFSRPALPWANCLVAHRYQKETQGYAV